VGRSHKSRWYRDAKSPPATKEERRGYISPSVSLSSLEGERRPVKAVDRESAIAKAMGYAWWGRVQNKHLPMYSRGLFVFVLAE
jgi:hypothetical protein